MKIPDTVKKQKKIIQAKVYRNKAKQ